MDSNDYRRRLVESFAQVGGELVTHAIKSLVRPEIPRVAMQRVDPRGTPTPDVVVRPPSGCPWCSVAESLGVAELYLERAAQSPNFAPDYTWKAWRALEQARAFAVATPGPTGDKIREDLFVPIGNVAFAVSRLRQTFTDPTKVKRVALEEFAAEVNALVAIALDGAETPIYPAGSLDGTKAPIAPPGGEQAQATLVAPAQEVSGGIGNGHGAAAVERLGSAAGSAAGGPGEADPYRDQRSTSGLAG